MPGRRLIPQLVTAPAAWPVSLAEVRAQLSIDTQDYDARLASLIGAATAMVEAFCGIALIQRSYKGFLDAWPRAHGRGDEGAGWPQDPGAWPGGGREARWLEIPMPPLISVDAVTTYDDTDAATIWPAAGNYYVDTSSSVGRLALRVGQDWPVPGGGLRTVDGIEIAWTCGLGPTLRPFLDEDIRVALLITVAMLNEQRGDSVVSAQLPMPARELLSPRRLEWL